MQEDEIDLREYINVMLKRKWTIILTFAAIVVTAFIMLSIMPKTYEAVAIVENGFIEKAIVNPADVSEVLKSFTKNENIKIESLSGTKYFRIVTDSNSSKEAKESSDEVVREYINYGNKLYEQQRKLADENLTNIENQIVKINEDTSRIETMISKLSLQESSLSSEKVSQIVLLQSTLPSYREQLESLLENKNKVRTILSSANEFKIINDSVEPKKAIKPKKKQMLALSVILGLMAGFFIAFFTEYWKKEEK